jgi:transposase
VLGFLDETSPQSGVNTMRLWSLEKPRVVKNTNNLRANTIGFYALNGVSLVQCRKDNRADNFCMFLNDVRRLNQCEHLVIILDNARTHRSIKVTWHAYLLGISFIYLPFYSPDLNPIEQVWKSIKRELTPRLFKNKKQMVDRITEAYYRLIQTHNYTKEWKKTILGEMSKKLQE